MIVGVSTDTLKDQERFTKMNKLNFPLLADTDQDVAKAYGALALSGRANRYTFVIDKEGKLRKIYTEVATASHPKDVVEYVKKELGKK